MVLAGFVGEKKLISGLPVLAPDTMLLTYFSYAYFNADAETNTCINTSLVVLIHVAFLLQQPRTERSITNPERGKKHDLLWIFSPFHFSTYKIKFCQKKKKDAIWISWMDKDAHDVHFESNVAEKNINDSIFNHDPDLFHSAVQN